MTTAEQLIDKAKEAFIMAIELYNKPTLRYRLEGFSFFICNAWELMLKAHLIKKSGEASVYYSDNPNRTISLENCIQRVFTNEKAPLRKNLEKIIELRNTSVHFITEEYESLYIPLLQACVFNFVDKMKEFHNIDMTEIIPENFITLSVRIRALDETAIRGKYSAQIAERLIDAQRELNPMIDENNSSFAIRVEHYHYATKDRSEATETYFIDKDAPSGVRFIKELKNPNATHKYTVKACIREINKRLHKNEIQLLFKGSPVEFNRYHFQLFAEYFELKKKDQMCFVYNVSSQPQYSYSQQAIDLIYHEIQKAPGTIIEDLRQKIKKPTPGARDSKR